MRAAVLISAALGLGVPAIARADDIATSEDVCRNAEIGSACTFDGGSGTCQEVDCTRLDYSVQPPKSVTRRCRDCRPGAPPATVIAPDPKATDPKAGDPKASDAKAADSKGAPAKDAGTGSSCSVSRDAGFAGSVGLGVLLLWLARRGRRP